MSNSERPGFITQCQVIRDVYLHPRCVSDNESII